MKTKRSIGYIPNRVARKFRIFLAKRRIKKLQCKKESISTAMIFSRMAGDFEAATFHRDRMREIQEEIDSLSQLLKGYALTNTQY